jgi:hypothetical protein
VKIVLKGKTNGKQYSIVTDADPRKWYTGNITLEATVALPSGITPGDYELFLFLPDKYTSITDRPEYAIRLANKDLWDGTTGMNKLNLSLTVL